MAVFVFPEVMRTMSSGDWLNTEESESAEKIVEELQNEGILNENKEYTREIERQDSKEEGGEKKDATKRYTTKKDTIKYDATKDYATKECKEESKQTN